MRDPILQGFLDALAAGFAASGPDAGARAFLDRLEGRLAQDGAPGHEPAATRPVVAHLPAAMRLAEDAESVARVAAALGRLAPRLPWKPRPSSGPLASANWADGHANAVIVGRGGIEERGDAMVGVSLLAPQVRYPDHDHPPEELYLVLTAGRFQHGGDAWVDLDPGALFHNPPGIRHAMASGATPLLAIWTMTV